jgi:hypothetical protein
LNPAGGRDHWPHGFTVALAGGGLPTGKVIGETDLRTRASAFPCLAAARSEFRASAATPTAVAGHVIGRSGPDQARRLAYRRFSATNGNAAPSTTTAGSTAATAGSPSMRSAAKFAAALTITRRPRTGRSVVAWRAPSAPVGLDTARRATLH